MEHLILNLRGILPTNNYSGFGIWVSKGSDSSAPYNDKHTHEEEIRNLSCNLNKRS